MHLSVCSFLLLLSISIIPSHAQIYGPPNSLVETTDGTQDVCLHDLDGDGDNDLLAACKDDDKLVWYENDGAGNYGKQKVIASLDEASAITAHDVDGDGDLDIIGGSDLGSNQWFENDGNQQFSAAIPIGTTNAVYRFHLHDLDGDGNTDLFTETDNGPHYWFAADGTGSYGSATLVSGISAGSTYLVDMELDGDVDIVYTNYVGDKVAWVANDGLGNFGSEQIIGIGLDGAAASTAHDVDGDGDIDVMAIGYISRDLVWFENLGSMTFGALQVIDFDVPNAESISMADLNGDGIEDIIVNKQVNYDVEWFAGLGSFGFGPSNSIDAENWARFIDVGTIDNNGSLDIVVVDPNNVGIRTLINDGSGNFSVPIVVTNRLPGSFHTVSEDIDGDGDNDLLVTAGSELIWFENNGLATPFTEHLITDQLTSSRGLQAKDLDNDGDIDVACTSWGDNTINWFTNDGTGSFGPRQILLDRPDGNGPGTNELEIADLDGDGLQDIVTRESGPVWFKNLGGGAFDPLIQIDPTQSSVRGLRIADLDGDGDQDLLFANSSQIHWYPNDGTGNFGSLSIIEPTASILYDIAVFDSDNDGDLDVAAGFGSAGPIVWYANDGTGNFGAPQTIDANQGWVQSLRAADVNLDGDLDLVACTGYGDEVMWYENLGAGTFSIKQPIDLTVDFPQAVHSTDLDGDGDLDLSACHRGDLVWYENLTIDIGPLAGNYIIGSSTAADYASFTEAIDSLISRGVDAPTTFVVESGTYTEQLFIPAIVGASVANTITFTSQSQDSSDVTLEWPSSPTVLDNQLIRMSNAGFFTFSHMTFSRTGASPNRVTIRALSLSHDIQFHNMHFENNLHGVVGTSDFILSNGTGDIGDWSIKNCYFRNGNGISFTSHTAGNIDISDNELYATAKGLRLSGTDCSVNFRSNLIEQNLYSSSKGIEILNASGDIQLIGNMLKSDKSTYRGIQSYSTSGSALFPIRIYNNVVLADVPSGIAIAIGANIQHFDIAHNSISCRTSSGGALAYGMRVDASGSSNDVDIRNNAIQGGGLGLVVIDDAGLSTVDHNVYFAEDDDHVIWNGVTYMDITSLNAATGKNANSKMLAPFYLDPSSDLHLDSSSPCLGAGVAVPSVVDDIEGSLRSNPIGSLPDVGAYESPLSMPAPMSGTYTIGSSVSADFDSFTAAINELIELGTDGDVIFEVETGSYDEKLHLPAINMVDANARIIFRGQDLDSSSVVLRSPALSTVLNDNHMIHMDGMDNVTWEYLTIERYGTGSYGNLFAFSGSGSTNDPSKNARIQHCQLVRSDLRNGIMIYGFGTDQDSVIIQNNLFTGGSSGINWSISGAGVDHMLVTENVFEDLIAGVRLTGVDDGIVVENNTIDLVFQSATASTGISVNYASSPVSISNNRITAAQNGQMLTLLDVDGTAADRVKVYNNQIIAQATGAQGIKVSFSTSYVDIHHNSVEVGGFGVFFQSATGASNIRWSNNAISTPDVAFNCAFETAIEAVDHMVLNTTGTDLARWGNTLYTDMTSLQMGTGLFSNSIQGDPLYVDPTSDLDILPNSPCRGAGATGLGVLSDIDGNTRPDPFGSSPDIGAHEIGAVKQLQVKIWLEGPFDSSTGLMKDDLRVAGLIPLTEPYSAMGYNWVSGGNESTTSNILSITGTQAIVDWVIVQLKDDSQGQIIEYDQAALVRRDGQLVNTEGDPLIFPGVPESHYLTILHRNHLAISSIKDLLISEEQPLFDFSDGSISAFGTEPMKINGAAHMLWAGDVNFDGELKYLGSDNDRDPILVGIGGSVPTNSVSGYLNEDVNMDGSVKYVGTDNDRDPILVNIGGSVPTARRVEQLP